MSEIPFETLTRMLHRTSTAVGRIDVTVQGHDLAIQAQGVDLADVRDRFNSLLSKATVVSLSPPLIKFPSGEQAKPDYSLVEPSTLAAGDTVLATRYGGKIMILGKVWVIA